MQKSPSVLSQGFLSDLGMFTVYKKLKFNKADTYIYFKGFVM